MKNRYTFFFALCLLYACGQNTDSQTDEMPSVDSVMAMIDEPVPISPEDGQTTSADPMEAGANAHHQKKRKEILTKELTESKVRPRGSCPEILELYREAVELAVEKNDNSKLKFFEENADDVFFNSCRQSPELKAQFKELDDLLNEEEEIY